MWQRFTERARRIILLAQEEAGKMKTGYVGPEHFLLGLMRDNEGVAAQVLQKMGVSLERVRQEIEAEIQPDSSTSEPKLTPKGKRVLELAADEARRMRHNYIGTEHLLLALLREKDNLAAQVLRRLGLNLEKTRSMVMEYLGPEMPTAAIEPEVTEIQLQTRAKKPSPEPEIYSVLLAVLAETDSPEVQILRACGLDVEVARQRLKARLHESTG